MWPAFPPREAVSTPMTTTTIIKHIHEYLPAPVSTFTNSASTTTAIKSVGICTAALFLKIWITASIEGTMLQRPPEDEQLMNSLKNNEEIDEQKLLEDIKRSIQHMQPESSTLKSPNMVANRISSSIENGDVHLTNTQQKLKQKGLLYDVGYRWSKILRNDLENIPITLMLAWAAIYNNANHKVTTICLSIFTISRFIHTYCYVNGMQPYRTVSYLAGMFATLTMAVNLVYSVFNETILE
eukprot:195271_1